MTFAAWCAQDFAGVRRLEALPLPQLHPLMQAGFAIDLTTEDGVITQCRFDVASAHRSDEKLLEVRDFRQGLALVQRHAWLTASFAEVLYAQVIEAALGMPISDRARALRTLSMELNTVATQAFWEHIEAEIAGEPSDALMRREQALAALEVLTGARMHSTYVRIGGVAHDAPDALQQHIAALGDDRLSNAFDVAALSTGPLQVQLPKVLRLPQGETYGELETPHGTLGCWVFGAGDKVPHRVHLRTPGFAALAALEQEAIGAPPQAWLMRLAHTRLALGEVAR